MKAIIKDGSILEVTTLTVNRKVLEQMPIVRERTIFIDGMKLIGTVQDGGSWFIGQNEHDLWRIPSYAVWMFLAKDIQNDYVRGRQEMERLHYALPHIYVK